MDLHVINVYTLTKAMIQLREKHSEFVVPLKLLRLNRMCLNETTVSICQWFPKGKVCYSLDELYVIYGYWYLLW
jgi:hypothetical protein